MTLIRKVEVPEKMEEKFRKLMAENGFSVFPSSEEDIPLEVQEEISQRWLTRSERTPIPSEVLLEEFRKRGWSGK